MMVLKQEQVRGILLVAPVELARYSQGEVRVREIWLMAKHTALQPEHHKLAYFPF